MLFGLGEKAAAEFDSPRIVYVDHKADQGTLSDSLTQARRYYISRGSEVGIDRGNKLNVYREKKVAYNIDLMMRIFIGTMIITNTSTGSSIGRFEANATAIGQPTIKYKSPMKDDIVVPRMIIASGVLFDPGKADLKAKAGEEFEKIANFVQHFSPAKLVIEGHTDADGERDANERLSKMRANVVRGFLVGEYDFISPNMIEALGYGEDRPIVNNNTPENKALNRRIEVIVWE